MLCFVAAHFISVTDFNKPSLITAGFEKVLHKKEKHLTAEVNELAAKAESKTYDELFSETQDQYKALYDREGLVLLIYENDTLQFWTDHSVAVENYLKEVCLEDKMVQLKNGWFEVIRTQSKPLGTKTVIGLIQVKREYAYQNRYLVNEFLPDFNLDGRIRITKDAQAANSIFNSRGEKLCSIILPEEKKESPTVLLFSILFSITGFVLTLFFLQEFFNLSVKKNGLNRSFLLFVIAVIILRSITITIHFPGILYNLLLFSPQLYGDAHSFWLSSLGDLLINVSLLFYLVYFFYKKIELSDSLVTKNPHTQQIYAGFFLLLLFFFSAIINYLFTGLIQNSNISFNINKFFSLNLYSYMAMLIIGLLLFCFFLLADKLTGIIKRIGLSARTQIGLFIVTSGVFILLSQLLGTRDWMFIAWPFPIVFFIALNNRKNQRKYTFSGIIIVLALMSIYSVYTLTTFTEIKEKESRKVLAEKLAAEQDPIAEQLFSEVENKIMKDTVSFQFSRPLNENFSKQLIQQYFGGYWEKYEVKISVYDTACGSLITPSGNERNSLSSYEEIIRKNGLPTKSKNFYYLNNSFGKISYLAQLPLYKDSAKKIRSGTLFIELNSKIVSEQLGFPELLLDRGYGIASDLLDYSYAKYKNGHLVNYYGEYPYKSFNYDFKNQKESPYLFANQGGYNHLFYQTNDGALVVLSKINEGWFGEITQFSYIFTFFSLLLLLLLLLYRLSYRADFSPLNFKQRIQYLLGITVLISILLVGGSSVFYIKKQFQHKNKEIISEKMFSVLIEMQQKIGEEQSLNPNYKEYFSFLLQKISNVFFTDINLYDVKGNLLASSLPKVFDAGLTSRKMCPEAYSRLVVKKELEFTDDEKIGNLDYLSAYIPFKNNKGAVLGYLNMPYFSKQSELKKEISSFLVALINTYVLLFALTVLLTVFISTYITKPLMLIQNKLGKIKFGKINERIEWKEKDEIGDLINEYNRMVEELAESAELLAQSERESAWREMAKQVAHEIKNPLTPMKLSIQHLQRLWDNKSPDMDKKVDQVTKTLIEQIDSLTSIANEFSNFAKMPRANNKKINLLDILSNSVNLYKASSEVEFNLELGADEESFIYADKEQMLQAFNNLLKNAMQAIPEESKGKIDIYLTKNNTDFLIQIRDNGTGIEEEKRNKLFIPNFTTKTGGMGLGLAITKKIIENSGGKIWFETMKGEGTSFFIVLPEFKE